MKIVTYNVNGLRARIAPYKTLHAFLTALDADIICFQETKLSRQELTSDIAMAEGYEAFFSCTKTNNKGKLGYSGVATFCRIPDNVPYTSGHVPIAADEGFTGMLHCSKAGQVEGVDRVGFYDGILSMGLPREELLCLDSEGRCVVTDHGSFVLFNIYGPCVQRGDTERMQFKLNFYKALQCRWESILRAGKRLIVVGDLNISPFPIDSCDPGSDFNSNPCRKWLRSQLRAEGGPFTDVYRGVHGLKKGAYTCWSQASGAEEFNFGTRIDLILAAGSCLGYGTCSDCKGFADCAMKDCDIMVQFKRFKDDTLPRWAGGRSLKLEGSDHAPVYVTLKEQPPVAPHEVPSLATRFLPQLRGRQQNIDALLQKRNTSSNGLNMELSQATIMEAVAHEILSQEKEIEVTDNVSGETSLSKACEKTRVSQRTWSSNGTSSLKVQAVQKFKRKESQKASQTSLKTFFLQTSRSMKLSVDQRAIAVPLSKEPALQESASQEWSDARPGSNGNLTCSSDIQESQGEPDKDAKQGNAQYEWKRIKSLMARRIPLCKHGEPCAPRIVKKSGPNLGRGFYVCARAEGPATNPEARCDHFEWASEKFKR